MLKTKKHFNIKTKMISMVVVAILIPLSCLIAFSRLYYKEIIEQKRNDEIKAQAQYAATIASERITSAIKLSEDITYAGEVEHYAKLLEQKKINEMLTYNYITGALKNKFYLNKEILFSAVLLECNPDQVYSVTADGRYRINDYLNHIHPHIEEMTKTLGNEVSFLIFKEDVYIIRNLISTHNFQKYGVIINEIETNYFFKEFLTNSHMQEYVHISLGEETIQLGHYNKQNYPFNQEETVDFSAQMAETDFTLTYEVRMGKRQLIAKELGLIKGVSLGVIIIVVLLSILLYWFYKSIIGAIEQLTKAFKAIEKGELGVVVPYERQDELGFLIQGFNDMSKQTKYLIDYVYKEELALKEAKIKALQSQINPHFINNTLEIINWKAQMIGGKEISKMIKALSVIMNASSSRTSAKMVPLKEEIIYMDSYLYILERRFEERIHIVKNIDEEILDSQVPLLIIQPILENAVVHGIEPAKGGEIVITIDKKYDIIHIVIANNGKPLDVEAVAYLQKKVTEETIPHKHNSVGMSNVNERIKLIYGEEFGLTITSNDKQMTEVCIKIPYSCTTNSNKAHTYPV